MGKVNILVTGSGSLYGVAIIKSLLDGPLQCKVIGCDTNPMTLGLYLAHRGYLVPLAKEEESWLKRIIEICKKESIDGIFIGSSHEIKLFARHRDIIKEATGATVFVHPPQMVDTCSDKWHTVLFLKNKGFYYPQTIPYPDHQAKLADFIKRVGFPLVVKPRTGAGSLGVEVVKTPRQLAEAIAGKENYIIQEYLPDQQGEYTVGVCINKKGDVLSSIALKRNLQDGMSVSALAEDYSDICGYCEQVARVLGAFGSCNLQLRIKNGLPYIFEINPRFSSSTGMRIALGVNEAELLIKSDLMGQQTEKPAIPKAGVIRQYIDFVIPIEDINRITSS
ncbi:ATP-grasp domain-containing protein [Desulfofalx alkaliphila]|uniref:ATP-grasp domain-containing protein n=1 Tax=Desulfofalx alkaliphila TaxID=105483 RepID=UPI0004E22FD4|nr:ATP-grasp domain-containing protein [Desulfofalx alkaliphila]